MLSYKPTKRLAAREFSGERRGNAGSRKLMPPSSLPLKQFHVEPEHPYDNVLENPHAIAGS
jgi:hypothetical protein